MIILKPAPKDFGIVFTNPLFPDNSFKIGTVIPEVAMQATVLKNDKWILSTTEHLLAAILGVGLDNVLVQVMVQKILMAQEILSKFQLWTVVRLHLFMAFWIVAFKSKMQPKSI